MKEGRVEDASHPCWTCFEEAFLGRLFPRELLEAKVREFLRLKQDSLSVHEYRFMFTQPSPYVLEMVKAMRSRIILLIVDLGRA